jgi:3-isopropylmalate dehydratase small subunit
MNTDRIEPQSYCHNDLYDAFEAGYLEGWQYNGGEQGYIRGAFEDWLRNKEAEHD